MAVLLLAVILNPDETRKALVEAVGAEKLGRILNHVFRPQGAMVGLVEGWVSVGAKAKAVVLVLRLKVALEQRFLV